ncbi:phosphotriesterase family protein [Mumia zhuanghuii]|uniref:Phosphotriesterase n=1 Tax=Mumia zhuanghuii TaxID=2585211 RepID=A0A5C4MMY0_9ACTN|nr:phosphotriesterase [Mumia zhuanghuii]TNC34612.1 phosphotriesterase [Mumia zhuanghuii]TNC43674.1 phosphotriesterase [Mumia zhuanghuii]
MTGTGEVQTFSGPVDAHDLGVTLIHEHVFVGHPELDLNFPHPEWDEAAAVETAVAGLDRLWELGVRTVVDLTVLGLGRDAARVARVAARSRVRLVASTGYYTADVLPPYFHTHGPGLLVGGPDPLVEMFVGDIEVGIAGTGVRAGMLKVVTDRPGITPDVARVIAAAAVAHQQTGVPITTHTHAPSQNGRDQLVLLAEHGVAADRVIVGHCGDSEDLDYLRELADAGATLGMDRFGMEHVLGDASRVRTVLELLRLGYADRMVLSHDAAFFSRVTPPSWRAAHAPNWHMENLHRRIVPMLREGGASEDDLEQMLVRNPARLLTPSR